MSKIKEHFEATKKLALAIKRTDVYSWLLDGGYFAENYVMPPCFTVNKRPSLPKFFFKRTGTSKKYSPTRHELVNFHFPKSEYTDRTFGIIHPHIHNDIALNIAWVWSDICAVLFHKDNIVSSYSFPLPISSKILGRLTTIRSGRMIYEYIGMTEEDIASEAYRYEYVVKADIKNFYPSIYTHSIAWSLHGKNFVRKKGNIQNYSLVGNRLDKLFQCANDGCTNGIPIGPVVSDVISELIVASVDREFSLEIKKEQIDCEVARFKDDYRILAKSESDAKRLIKLLQSALKSFNLELSDEKTSISKLPDGLFRDWVSKYYSVNPSKKESYSWKEFREIYLSVVKIDKECPGTGVIDRFLSDIINKQGELRVNVSIFNLKKVISMLLMLGRLRIKAFPKIMAIIEVIIKSPWGILHKYTIVDYLKSFLVELSKEEFRNKYLISWLCYFLVSNKLDGNIKSIITLSDPITKSILNNRNSLFTNQNDFKLFEGCVSSGRRISLVKHLDVFDPPKLR
ncbi:RNA-directed DNA polymerase [Ferrimonas balearica]|uniref:RNA-directed DNA polymerase n=1 Tax=Ferrimonas balearica TaxID=44012 RepID=UPI001C9911D2|nr:RNA-directed DNA polymerase [Ferrimonas balearica]MBY5920412.1 RNA-directed DNA polymerase [Ferrimonas balearica]MBY5996903.1 RNA-directed DNA polymerase [Ferrimonas balearica]